MKLRLTNPLDQRPALVRTPLPGFDPVYYLARYEDVRGAGLDPLRHFLLEGWKEGRDPSAGFSTSGYFEANPDVRAAGLNPLLHFVNIGLAEGRNGYAKDRAGPAAPASISENGTSEIVENPAPPPPPDHHPSQGDPSQIMARYIEDTPSGQRGINLGCGYEKIENWVNIDSEYPWHVTIYWDLRGDLPFVPDGTMDAVYSEHFMEHVPRAGGLKIMEEAYRVLQPGGHIRIAMPDLDDLTRHYAGTPSLGPDTRMEFADLYGDLIQTKGEWFNIAMRAWGHMYVYNYEDIAIILEKAGFFKHSAREIESVIGPIPIEPRDQARRSIQPHRRGDKNIAYQLA